MEEGTTDAGGRARSTLGVLVSQGAINIYRVEATGIEVEPDLASPGEAGCTDWPSRPQSRLLVLGGGVRWVDPVLVEGSEGL